MKHCTICWQECTTQQSKYCLKCARLLRKNWNIASNLKKAFWVKFCPICFRPIHKHDTFCKKCNATMQERKQILFFSPQIMSKEYLELEYEYIIKEPHFYRKNRKDYVDYKIVDAGIKKWYKFSQNLEILYKEWLPKRNRFQSKEKYFHEYLVPIVKKQYERWRLNQIWFWVDVAVETILQSKRIDDAKNESS